MNTKLKVYLSKSKSGNFDELVKLKSRLELLDIEVLEFVGGTYNTDKLLEADILLVLPPIIDNGDTGNWAVVGKGQFEEIEIFTLNKLNNALLVTSLEDIDDVITVEEISGVDEITGKYKNWQTNYGQVITNEQSMTILNYNTPLKPKTKLPCTKNLTNQAKHILICVNL
jgi:hypothetical protein